MTIYGAGWAEAARRAMVLDLEGRGINDERVLAAMAVVPRHELVPEAIRGQAYDDNPLPIGEGQTISQPHIVALMTQAAAVQPGDKVLEVGVGSGYQAAVLAAMGVRVFSVEVVPTLAQRAREDLARLGITGVQVRTGDGYQGWPEEAPFAAVLVTAAPPSVPKALYEQLAQGGRLVLPVGRAHEVQRLEVHEKGVGGEVVTALGAVRFVPMVGEAQEEA